MHHRLPKHGNHTSNAIPDIFSDVYNAISGTSAGDKYQIPLIDFWRHSKGARDRPRAHYRNDVVEPEPLSYPQWNLYFVLPL